MCSYGMPYKHGSTVNPILLFLPLRRTLPTTAHWYYHNLKLEHCFLTASMDIKDHIFFVFFWALSPPFSPSGYPTTPLQSLCTLCNMQMPLLYSLFTKKPLRSHESNFLSLSTLESIKWQLNYWSSAPLSMAIWRVRVLGGTGWGQQDRACCRHADLHRTES